MIECKKCAKNDIIKSGVINLLKLNQWLKSITTENDIEATNFENHKFSLFKCRECNTYWEWRPLYEETMYGGEPGEWVKVTEEYVREHYPDTIKD